MKKFLTLLLSLVLILQMIPAARAATPAVAALSSKSAGRGETVAITLSVSNCVDAKSMYVRPQYDAAVLTLVSGTWLVSGLLADDWSAEFGDAALAFASNTDINKDVFQLVFTVKEDAAIGAADVDCEVVIKTMDGQNEVPVSVNVTKGTVTVTDGTGTNTPIPTTPMYRLYNPNSGEHFYTGSADERDILKAAGWNYEGVAWNAPIQGGTPVHRVYNPNSGDHHYTMDKGESDWLVSLGWQYEGVAWNSAAQENNIPQYRLWNPNADCGSHHYTSDDGERDMLVAAGWILEGIGWYGTLQ